MTETHKAFCKMCGEEMPPSICAYWNMKGRDGDFSAHIGCAESEIEVFRVEAIGQGSFYFDTEFPPVDLWDGCDAGEGYRITREKMSAGKYHTLPEFTGF